MANKGDLIGANGERLFVGADHSVEYRNYEADAKTPKNMAGWTIVLDIRKKDTSADPALVSKVGAITGTFNVNPDLNTQVCTFTLAAADLAATKFTEDDRKYRYSIVRTDTGNKQPLIYGNAEIIRVTQV